MTRRQLQMNAGTQDAFSDYAFQFRESLNYTELQVGQCFLCGPPPAHRRMLHVMPPDGHCHCRRLPVWGPLRTQASRFLVFCLA